MATGKSRKAGGSKKPSRPRCRTCNKPIPIPDGWTLGPAVRRHYWAKHREVMSGESSGKTKKPARRDPRPKKGTKKSSRKSAAGVKGRS